MSVGICSMLLGSGRERKEDEIDLSAGVVLKKKSGDYVQQGEPLAILYYNLPYQNRLAEASTLLAKGYQYAPTKPQSVPLIAGIIR